MDLTRPMSSVIPSAHGPVLVALARAGAPMSGRQIAGLVEGQVGRSRVNGVLHELVQSGIVTCDAHPPAMLYRLNRAHVAAPFIEGLASLREQLLERLRKQAATWAVPAVAVWLFGSAARGDGTVDSDIDVLVIRPDDVGDEDPAWVDQVDVWQTSVKRWAGNDCSALEMTARQVRQAVANGDPLVEELRRDAVWLAGGSPRDLLRDPSERNLREFTREGKVARRQG